MHHYTIYKSFRFGFYIPEKGEFIGASAIHSDPFTGDLWIVKAHVKGEPTLATSLADVSSANIFLFEQGAGGGARKLNACWSGARWSPLDMDATENKPALDRMILTAQQKTSPPKKSQLPGS